MAIIFAVRGDSLNARYSSGGKTAGAFGGAVVASDGTALSGSRINLDSGSISTRFAMWPGRNNVPTGRAFSTLIRFKTGYSGTPSSTVGIFTWGGALMGNAGGLGAIAVQHLATSGNLTIQVRDESNANSINGGVAVTGWNPTAGTWYDLVVAWDGTATASAFKTWIDASAQTSLTPGTAWPTTRTQEYVNQITLGFGYNQANTRISVDEFTIWDSVIDPTSVALVSGTGSLNGASRTSLVDVSSFDGLSYSDPGASNVKTGTSYTYAGTSQSGTYDGSDRWTDPGEANVKTGTAYKANSTTNNKTGTYDGSDRWTDPGEANVRYLTAYKANSTTNNKSGLLDIPVESAVLDGYTYDDGTKTGTLTIPSAADIADAVWDEDLSTHSTAGSASKTLKDAKLYSSINL